MKKKNMKNKRKKKLSLIVLLILVLGISVGYAALSSDLNISGTSTIGSPDWDVHWENVSVTSGSVSAPTPTIDPTRTTVSYSVTLNTPGDFYEFTVNAVNGGTIDAMIESVSSKLNGTEITTLPDYLEYSVTYNGGLTPTANQILSAGFTDIYKVRIGFKRDITEAQLPTVAQTLNMSFTINYIQASESGTRSYYNVFSHKAGDTVEGFIGYGDPEILVSAQGVTIAFRYDVQDNEVIDVSAGLYSGNPSFTFFKPKAYTASFTKENHVTLLNNEFGGNYCTIDPYTLRVVCNLASNGIIFENDGTSLIITDFSSGESIGMGIDGSTTSTFDS